MNTQRKVIKEGAPISLIPQLLFMGALWFAYGTIIDQPFLAPLMASSTYLLASFLLKRAFICHHMAGIALLRENRYQEALTKFQDSYDFFEKHPWIDKYRYITFLASSRISYTEMALVNAAFCCMQLHMVNEAKEYYQKALMIFPFSKIAKSALQEIEAYERMKDSPSADS